MVNTLKECQDVLAEQQLKIERLTIENKLLRAASESQRELNGTLRIQLLKMAEKHEQLNRFVGGE
jgi:hypothetical protein